MVLSMAQFEAFVPMRNTLAVFGNPIEHSLSPALHIEFGRQSGLDFDYIAINVTPDEFPRAMELAREKLYGFNCTMPFKKLVVPYLDEIDEASKMLASVNTVLVHNKRLIGCSTDGAGMLDALTLSGCTIPNMQVLIVGNGGAALSIAHDLALGGAHITALVRSAEKGRIFADTLKDAAGLDAFSWTLAPDLTDDYDIIINATPLGMSDGDASPVNLNDFTRVKHVSDCIYDPPITALLLEAAKKGISWENGLPMLVAQGARSQKFWFNIEFSPEELSNTILSLRASRAKTRLNAVRGKANIALTGFMGCGKTTIGKRLAQILDMNFVDLDAKIESEQRMKIAEIFEKHGELRFRELEAIACNDCLNLENTIIATGGGTIIRDKNAEILRSNSLILFLNRTFEQIEKNLEGSDSRPLLQVHNVREHIRSLYEFRQPQYLANADVCAYFPENISDPAPYVLYYI